MSKSIRTAKEAAIKLADMLLEIRRDDFKSGVEASFLELYGCLTKATKEAVARYFIKEFIVWNKGINWITRVVRAPGIDVFVALARYANDAELLNSLAEELSRTGWRSVEELIPYLGRPLSEKEISLLCDDYCSRGCASSEASAEFYNLAVRNGHGRAFAMEVGMRIQKHNKELSRHAD